MAADFPFLSAHGTFYQSSRGISIKSATDHPVGRKFYEARHGSPASPVRAVWNHRHGFLLPWHRADRAQSSCSASAGLCRIEMRSGLISILVYVCCVSTAAAQQPRAWIRPPARSVLFTAYPAPTGRASAADTTNAPAVHPTHWKKGLLIGGVIGGLGLGGLAYALCEELRETQESCLGPGLGGVALGGVMGGITGALIGGAFPKTTETTHPADSTTVSN